MQFRVFTRLIPALLLPALAALGPVIPAPSFSSESRKDASTKERKKSTQPRVVINEIHYQPVPNTKEREFLELFNPNREEVDLSGWSITGQVEYKFPAGTRIGPQGFLVIGGEPASLGKLYGLKEVLGPYEGGLSRKGGNVALLDSKGHEVDSVTYDNKPPFPVEAAGGGPSLERIHPDFSAGRHWLPGAVQYEWVRVEQKGLLSGDRLLFYLDDEGSCLIDDVRVVSAKDITGPNAVGNSGFESGTGGWRFTGNHSGERLREKAKEGTSCLRLSSKGPGFGEIHSASVSLGGIPLTTEVILSFWVMGEEGTVNVVARILGDGLVTDAELPILGGSPGKANRVREVDLAPWVQKSWHEPTRPLPGKPVVIFGQVLDDEAVAGVTLEYSLLDEEKERTMPMANHGMVTPLGPVYSCMLPPLSEGEVVRYRILAWDAGGKQAPLESQTAFYVGKPVSRRKSVDAFELLISPQAVTSLERYKKTWVPAMVIFDGVVYDQVRVRHRGHSSLGYPKRHFKIRFDGEKFEGKTKTVNLSASWADKSYLRELLAYNTFADAGAAHCKISRYARLYLNGKYWGLYYQLEQPGSSYLKRNGYNPDGDLFKCYAAGRPSPSGHYSASDYEYETNNEAPYEILHEFLTSMDFLTGDELQTYIKKRVNIDDFVAYLAATALVMNSDHVGKNYFLYRNPKTGKWSMLPWDLDLTFGRNYECGIRNALLNDKIRWDNHILFGTEAYPKCDIKGNRLIEKFLSIRENRILLYKKLVKMLRTFNVARINRLIQPHYNLLRSESVLDRKRWGAYGPQSTWDFDGQVRQIQQFVANRIQFLAQGLREAAANP